MSTTMLSWDLFCYGFRGQTMAIKAATNAIVRKFCSDWRAEVRTPNYSEHTSLDKCCSGLGTSDPNSFPLEGTADRLSVLASDTRWRAGAGEGWGSRGERPAGTAWEAPVTWPASAPVRPLAGPSRTLPRAGGRRGRAHGRKRAARPRIPASPAPHLSHGLGGGPGAGGPRARGPAVARPGPCARPCARRARGSAAPAGAARRTRGTRRPAAPLLFLLLVPLGEEVV